MTGTRIARMLGVLVQALLIGTLLALALLQFALSSGAVQVFRYEAF